MQARERLKNLQIQQRLLALTEQRRHLNHDVRFDSAEGHYWIGDNECYITVDQTGANVQSNLVGTLHDGCNVQFSLSELELAYNFFCSVSMEDSE